LIGHEMRSVCAFIECDGSLRARWTRCPPCLSPREPSPLHCVKGGRITTRVLRFFPVRRFSCQATRDTPGRLDRRAHSFPIAAGTILLMRVDLVRLRLAKNVGGNRHKAGRPPPDAREDLGRPACPRRRIRRSRCPRYAPAYVRRVPIWRRGNGSRHCRRDNIATRFG
jgi:hypothetical protein